MKEKILIWLAWKMPRGLAKWAAIRVMTAGRHGEPYAENPAERTCGHALNSWGHD